MVKKSRRVGLGLASPIQDFTVVAIKKVVIPKSREGRIAANDPAIKKLLS